MLSEVHKARFLHQRQAFKYTSYLWNDAFDRFIQYLELNTYSCDWLTVLHINKNRFCHVLWKQYESIWAKTITVRIKQCLTDEAIGTPGKSIVTHTCMLQCYGPIQYNQHCIIFYSQSLWRTCIKPCLV